jgi:hypothetical protein
LPTRLLQETSSKAITDQPVQSLEDRCSAFGLEVIAEWSRQDCASHITVPLCLLRSHRPTRRNDWIRSFGYTGQSRWRSVSRRSLDCRNVAAGRWSLRIRRLRRYTRNKLKRNTLSRQIRPMIALAVGGYFQLDIRPWISFWIVSANADRKSGHLLTR